MTHPFLDDIVYPRTPDQTFNFDYDRLRRIPAVVTKTLASSGVAQYPEFGEDVIIHEVWAARDLSTSAELFRLFRQYHTEVLPAGRYIGWQPRDKSPFNYLIKLLDVRLGRGEDLHVEELGREPRLMREDLVVTFKLVAEAKAPALVVVAEGD